MDLGLGGKVALVTGASKGIGLATAHALAAEGARVALASRSRERIDAAASAVGGGARGFVFDSEDLAAVPRLLDEVESALGPVDVYVANTGGPPADDDPFGSSVEEWEAANRSLVLSPMAVLERLLPEMRERGWGRVVVVSSFGAREPIPSLQLSNAYRPGLLAALKVLARQAAADGVTLNAVLPGFVATDRVIENRGGTLEAAEEAVRHLIPAGRMGSPEELAAAIAFLCSEPASYVNGVALVVDGALTRGI